MKVYDQLKQRQKKLDQGILRGQQIIADGTVLNAQQQKRFEDSVSLRRFLGDMDEFIQNEVLLHEIATTSMLEMIETLESNDWRMTIPVMKQMLQVKETIKGGRF